jgi:hypothetical protein
LSIEQFKHTTNQKEFESLNYKDAADEWSKMSESSKISVANQMMAKLEVAGRTEKIPDSELSKYQKIYQEAEKLSNVYEKEGEERLNKMQGILNKAETEVMNFAR